MGLVGKYQVFNGLRFILVWFLFLFDLIMVLIIQEFILLEYKIEGVKIDFLMGLSYLVIRRKIWSDFFVVDKLK